jgi:hypothetical protein
LHRSLKYMPGDVAEEIKNIFAPQTIAVVQATLTAWAIAHFIAIGELAEFILLIVGFAALGCSALTLAQELVAFVTGASNATNKGQLEDAGKHFAKAVALVGVQVIMAILLRRPAKSIKQKGLAKNVKPSLIEERPPRPGPLTIRETAKVEAGKGWTDWYPRTGPPPISSGPSFTKRSTGSFGPRSSRCGTCAQVSHPAHTTGWPS